MTPTKYAGVEKELNPELIAQIAAIGHTEYLVIADAGLPVPNGVKVIDLSVVRGVPTFEQVLSAVREEVVSDAYIVAGEMPGKSPELYACTGRLLAGLPETRIPHEEFKALTRKAKAIVRTGETTPYANVILVAGVNF